jgi:hypothetical protein
MKAMRKVKTQGEVGSETYALLESRLIDMGNDRGVMILLDVSVGDLRIFR